MQTLLQDLRYGARTLAKEPGYTLIALMILSLGIGANTAIFSVVNAVLFRPMPGFETDRVVMLFTKTADGDQGGVHGEYVRDWRTQAAVFERIEAGNDLPFTLTGVDPPESVSAAIVTPGYFTVYRIQAAYGRLFLPEEEKPGRGRVVVLDFDFWQRRFVGDPGIVGRRIKLNQQDYTVVGIAPQGFHPLGRGQESLYVPLVFEEYTNMEYWAVARLKTGATLEQAKAEMAAVSKRLSITNPAEYKGVEAHPVPALETWVSQIRGSLLLLFAAVALVLLIACANVANLLLARGAARHQEFAIRLALGASPWRLARQMVVETLPLAFAGGVAGFLLAAWVVSMLPKLSWLKIPRLDEVGIDLAVLAFNLLVVVLTTLLCAIAPALMVVRQDISRGLEAASRGFSGARLQNRARNGLIIAQIAITFVLVYASGLLAQSFAQMQRVDLGYDPRNVLTFAITLPETTDSTGQQIIATYDRILERLQRLPGVEKVGLSISLPTGEGVGSGGSIDVVGRPTAPTNSEISSTLRVISADYHQLMRIPLLAGRLFDERDRQGRPNVVIINEAVARRFFPGQNPIGQRLMGGPVDPNMRNNGGGDPFELEIIGVVGEVKQRSVTDQGLMETYVPYSQCGLRFSMVALRTTGDPLLLIPTIQREIHALEKDLPISDIQTMADRASELTAQFRIGASIFSLFALLAFILSFVGVYGVISYLVTHRRHELGVRTALGAQSFHLYKLILGQGLLLMLAGAGIGIPASLLLARYLSALLFGVSSLHPATILAAALLLIFATLLACWIPARRATIIDPLAALRCE